jgi:two-component system response regulator PilR (NtrC family)
VTAPAGRLGRILIVEDDAALLDQLTWALKSDFEIVGSRDATAASLQLGADFDVFLFDLRLPPSLEVQEGLNLLAEVRRRDPDATVVMMSGEGERTLALKAIQAGAFDFFQKPVDKDELKAILHRALERRRLLLENRALRRQSAGESPVGQLLGASPAMERLRSDIGKVAPSDASVLILGESGTGKELVARSIHAGSRRAAEAFVAVNASAMPESLAESELFGHEKGSFTGAIASRPGRFELARGGTLFLDEIGTFSAGVQAKLLRAIEQKEIERVGGRRPIPVDFRLVSATNEDLEARVAAGTFREDLFYRINTIILQIPPLRERRGDLRLLASHFLVRYAVRHGKAAATLSPAALERLEAHPWRGNVRELEHVLETLVLFSEGEEIGEEDLPRALRRPDQEPGGASGRGLPFGKAVEDYEKKLLSDAIVSSAGVKAEAARRLGLDSNQMKYLCRKYGL